MSKVTVILSALVSTYLFILNVNQIQMVDAVRPSAGCFRKKLPGKFKPGKTSKVKKKVEGGTPKRIHSVTLPSTYDENAVRHDPPPLLLFFHGWGGSHKSCGKHCTVDAPNHGFVTVRMSGYGKKGWKSWQFYGSSSSADGGAYNMTTCDPDNVYGSYCHNYKECDCDQSDGCWWTTCHDSVGQVIQMLNYVESKLCVDLDRVWASGCSNGGMFTYELARDPRTAKRLRGIAPIVGLPHWGYSTGPMKLESKTELEAELVEKGISYFGMFGKRDPTVPPLTNSGTPDLTVEEMGWRYTAYNKTVADWTKGNGCNGDGQTPLIGNEYNTTSYGFIDCLQGCEEKKDTNHVVGCLFRGKHVCYQDEIPWEPMFEFMLSQN